MDQLFEPREQQGGMEMSGGGQMGGGQMGGMRSESPPLPPSAANEQLLDALTVELQRDAQTVARDLYAGLLDDMSNYRDLLSYILTVIYTGSKIFENLGIFTIIYTGKKGAPQA